MNINASCFNLIYKFTVSFLFFLIVFFVNVGSVKAQIISTQGYYDCGTSWPSYFAGEECYIRGTYLPHSGWNSAASCSMTNKISYVSTGQQYYFCDPARTAVLTGKEVIGFVRWNGSGTFVIINVVELAEVFNQPPNQPSIIQPQSVWELGPKNNGSYPGMNCSVLGNGEGCNIDFVTNSLDPDFYLSLNLQATVVKNEGGDLSYTQQLTSNNQTYTKTQTLTDGHWNFSAQNCDTAGECSGFTSSRTFLVDTTAPIGIDMIAEPEFTNGVQNTISGTQGSDNIVGGIEYEFQVDDDQNFASPNNSSGWINTNNFIFTNLADNTTYYYRVRARDRLYNTGNWSTPVFSTQDSTAPQIQNVSATNNRISPQNNDGKFDNTLISFDWIEKYIETIKVEIVDSNNNVVKTASNSNLSGSENPTQYQFVWDGKSDSNAILPDGAYIVKLAIKDKAQNIATDDSTIIIIDNAPPNLNVSNPQNNSWFSQSNVVINGQTSQDATLYITNDQTKVTSSLSIDSLGIFSTDETLQLGVNNFTLISYDSVGNNSTVLLTYYFETNSPTINSITPNDLINNRQPVISLDLTDEGNGNYISGIEPGSIFISLTHETNGETVLVNFGVNTAVSLGNISQNCDIAGPVIGSTATNCIYKFILTSDIPDGKYSILIKVKDKAGNAEVQRLGSFEIDSNIQSDLILPTSGNLFNYSKIRLTGTAERNSMVKITLPFGDLDLDSKLDNEVINVAPNATNSSRTLITNCRSSNNPTRDGIVEICDWEINTFQLEKNLSPGNLINQIQITAFDNMDVYPNGLNSSNKIVMVNVDLYAVTLTIDSDIEYFSPNGDGKQDGINFSNISSNGNIGNYTLEIKDEKGNVVKKFQASGIPTASISWDGRDESGNFVKDGTYTFEFIVTTTDGIEFKTSPVYLYAVTAITDRVVITYPKNNSYSTRGVITIQGQAPENLVNSQSSELQIKICVDTLSILGQCDKEYYTTVDQNDLFSTVIMLPRINSQDEHSITATAIDKYGNETHVSNNVKVTTVSMHPFESVQIIPVLTGTNNHQAYQIILDKLNNGETISQVDIDSLRSIIIRSNVYQGTERVKFSFTDYSKVSQLSSITNWNQVGYISGDNITNLYKNFTEGVTQYKPCATAICTWDFYYPIQPDLAGLYEINFEGKLDVEVQNLTAGFTVDGNIPIAPIILDVNKGINGSFANTNYYNNAFYSNSEILQIKGASDPNAKIDLKDQNGNNLCTTIASGVGIWSCEVNTSQFSTYNLPNLNTYELKLTTYATLGLNAAMSVDNKTVVIDKVAPQIKSLTTQSQFRKSGDVTDLGVAANEDMSYSILIDKQNPQDYDQCINSVNKFDLLGTQVPIQLGSIYDLNLVATDLTNAQGSFVISGHAIEGRYCVVVRIADLAGNTAEQNETFFIDNTPPEVPIIDTSSWGKYNGIKTQLGYIAKGRLVPEFTHEENQVKIKAWGEENTKLEFFVNGKLVNTSELLGNNCTSKLTNDKFVDSVNLQDKDICLYEFTYPLTVNGKDYVFQIKAIDRAQNKSIISKSETIYYDNEKPIAPEVVHSSSTSYDPTPDWNLGLKNSITKDLKIILTTHAETLSDLEFKITGPQKTYNYKYTQTSATQLIQQEIELGTSSDEKSECIEIINGKRTGICEDGTYLINIVSTDAAGNASVATIHEVERDTVSPSLPVANEPFLCGSSICVDISGEIGSQVWSNGNLVGILSENNQKLILISNWNYSTNYNFAISLIDKAFNSSEVVSKSISTPEPSLGLGALNGATLANTYANLYGSNLEPVSLDLVINAKDGSYKISNLTIPAPKMTFVHTKYNDLVDLYGIGLPSNHALEVNKKVLYTSYTEAWDLCGRQLIPNEDGNRCLEKYMGINSIGDWLWETKVECKIAIPIYTPICEADKYFNKRKEEVIVENYTILHSKINFVKDDSDNTYIDSTSNDNGDGRFYKAVNLNTQVNIGDFVKAKSIISGTFETSGITIDYGNIDGKESTSDFSNPLEVEKSEYVNLGGVEAKILPVPYFNQWLEPNGKKNPTGGWFMCGAAASTIVAGYFDKLSYNKSDEHDLKRYMFSDQGMGLGNPCNDLNKAGTFAVTQYTCNQSYQGGVIKYLKDLGLRVNLLIPSAKNSDTKKQSFQDIKNAIDDGHPLIFDIHGPGGFGHFATVVGYTTDGRIVVNDPYTNLFVTGQKWSKYDSGKHAIYKLFDTTYTNSYFLEIYK